MPVREQPAPPPLSTVRPPAGFSPWFPPAWIAWLCLSAALALLGAGRVVVYLLPGAPDEAMLFCGLGAVFFLSFIAPAWWIPPPGRKQLLSNAIALLLLVWGPLTFLAVVASRVYPLPAHAGARLVLLSGVFAASSYAVFSRLPRWYPLLQAMFAVGLPLLEYLLRQMAATYAPKPPGIPWLTVGSIFAAVADALHPGRNTLHAYPLWLATGGLYLIVFVVVLALGCNQDGPRPNANDNPKGVVPGSGKS